MSLSKRKEAVAPSAPPWMVTYSDLVTQLLIFFVMLFALSSAAIDDQLKKIKERIDAYVVTQKLEQGVITKITLKEGLVISFREKLMFDPGKADIHPTARTVVTDIVQLIKSEPNRIAVEGHTDNTPISTERFPSNWELSTARATNVARFLLEDLRLDPQRLSSSGYGEFQPVEANTTPQGRASNRRIDMVVRRLDLEEAKEWNKKLSASAREVVNQGPAQESTQAIPTMQEDGDLMPQPVQE